MLKTERLESQIILKILRARQLLGTVNFKRYIFSEFEKLYNTTWKYDIFKDTFDVVVKGVAT
jgi:hypothetical protein